MDMDKIIVTARQRLADLWSAPFHKHAILDGAWDEGTLMKAMIEKVTAEALAHREEENPDD
jgi:hypothetical protein